MLISLVLNKNEAVEVRSECAEALGYIGDKGARHALRATLADGEPEVRFWSAFALYQLGDIKAIPLLKEQIKRESATIPHWGEVRKEMSRALRALVAESKGQATEATEATEAT